MDRLEGAAEVPTNRRVAGAVIRVEAHPHLLQRLPHLRRRQVVVEGITDDIGADATGDSGVSSTGFTPEETEGS